MKTSQSFVFYPTDFLLGTALFSASEVGAYIRLLCYQWQEGSLPNDENLLTRLACSSLSDVQAIISKFQQGTDGKLRNRRLEEVRKELIASRKRRSNAGKQGGRPRKAMLSDSLNEEKAIQSSPSPSPSPSPSTFHLEHSDKPPARKAKKEKPPADPRHQLFIKAFCDSYLNAIGQKFDMSDKKHGAQMSRFLKAHPDIELEEWQSAIDWCYQVRHDPFAKAPAHNISNLAAFCAGWPQLVAYHQIYQPKK